MAANTMDAIKKKMQAMKLDKEAALDKADQLEQALNEQKEKNEKVNKPFISYRLNNQSLHVIIVLLKIRKITFESLFN